MADSLEDAIRENASGPRRAVGDEGEVEQHSIRDQIAADRYLAGKKAAKKKNRGLRYNRIVPDGTT